MDEYSGSRKIRSSEISNTQMSSLRAFIAKRSLDELGLSMAEIARHVGVTTSSIAKAVARLEEDGQ